MTAITRPATEALPQAAHMGQELSRHGAKSASRKAWLIIALVSLAVTLGAALFALWRWYFITVTFGPALVSRMLRPALWMALGFAILALLALMASRRRQSAAIVYEAGLLVDQGRRRRWIHWTDILAVRISAVRYGLHGVSWGGRVRASLDLAAGRSVRLPSGLEAYPELIEAIKRAVYPRLADGYRQLINQGLEVGFGPIRLTQQGVLHGRKLLRWQDLGACRLEGGQLVLTPRLKAPRIRLPAEQVPNVDLCFQLIQQLGQNP
jgi:hypothetical protein